MPRTTGNRREQRPTSPSVFADFPTCSRLFPEDERIGETGTKPRTSQAQLRLRRAASPDIPLLHVLASPPVPLAVGRHSACSVPLPRPSQRIAARPLLAQLRQVRRPTRKHRSCRAPSDTTATSACRRRISSPTCGSGDRPLDVVGAETFRVGRSEIAPRSTAQQPRISPKVANSEGLCTKCLARTSIIAALPGAKPHWLDHVEEVGTPLLDQPSSPICFLLGAGASLSSGGPRTEDILAICRKRRPKLFGSDEQVYARFSTRLTPRERENIIRPLFEEFTPYAGYRCLAAMALTRPVFVVNLNWDSAVKEAAERVGADAHCFDLKDVKDGGRAVASVLKAKRGIACAHVHGILDSPTSKIRFSHSHTLAFKSAELALLTKLLRMFTIVAGTSLTGPQDAFQLLDALGSPPLPRKKGGPGYPTIEVYRDQLAVTGEVLQNIPKTPKPEHIADETPDGHV